LNVKPPRFLNDLYRDLRDRHLLLPAVALLVALIAVPVLLAKPAEPAPPLPAAAAAGGDVTAVTSAVLVDGSVPVRQYKKRLAKLKSKNPFDVNIKVQQTGGGGSGGGGSSDTTSTSTTPAGTTPTTPAGTSTPPSGSPTTPPTSSDVPSGTPTDTTTTPGDTTGGSTNNTPTQPEIRFFAGRVDVTMGPIGKGRDYDDVKYLTFLPDDATPIAAFVGLTGNGDNESAVFAISQLAEVVDGDGTCAPHKPTPCQFLTLKPGESRYIKYDGKTYRLNVRHTHVVAIKDPSVAAPQGNSNGNGGTSG
jgi:hypothetical protein